MKPKPQSRGHVHSAKAEQRVGTGQRQPQLGDGSDLTFNPEGKPQASVAFV